MQPMSEAESAMVDLDPTRLKEVCCALSQWVRRGGPQRQSGAFSGWRSLATGALSTPYPEITGYALNFLSQMPLAGPEWARAGDAARWLADRIEHRQFSARPDGTGRAVYAFDLAMIGHGLIRYGRISGGDRYVAAGVRSVEVLLRQVRGGSAMPCVLPGTSCGLLSATWSTVGRPHMVKIVQALLSAAELGVRGAEHAAANLIRELGSHCPKVPLATQPGSNLVWLHPTCYAAEGLWIWGIHTGDLAALRQSRSLTEWVWQQRLPSGGFTRCAQADGGPVGSVRQSDVLAQAIRLGILHRIYEAEAVCAADRLAADTWRGYDQAAVYYWPEADLLHLNSWCSMFAVQALELCIQTRHTLNWRELV